MEFCFASLIWVLLQCWTLGVVAQVDCAPASKSFTIKTAQDVADIRTCETFTGNIVVAADGPEEVSLDGIRTLVSGNIDVEGVVKLRSLSSTTLETVSSFTLNNLPELSTLSFPALRTFSSLKWNNLPSLQEATIATGDLTGEIQEITIVHTSLQNLNWLKWPIGSQLNITNNNNLKTFTIPYNTINAGSAITLSDNAALETLGFSSLTAIYGGLDISQNKLATQISFDTLENIGGFVKMTGEFTNVSMPALNTINGALRVESAGDISTLCNDLEKKNLTGHYDCITQSQLPTLLSTAPVSTPTSTSGNDQPESLADEGPVKLSMAVKIGLGVGAVVITVVILLLAFFYFRRRSKAKVREIPPITHHRKFELSEQPHKDTSKSSLHELDSPGPWGGASFPKELESPMVDTRQELPGAQPQELDATYARPESTTPISRMSWGSERSHKPFLH